MTTNSRVFVVAAIVASLATLGITTSASLASTVHSAAAQHHSSSYSSDFYNGTGTVPDELRDPHNDR